MNSCILMAQIIQDPELRYTPDNQTPIAQMLVQFPNQRAEDPPVTLKVVGWGNFAQEMKENYAAGDRVVIEGRLSMITVDRPEGFKEKRAELTASRIHKLGADTVFEPHVATPSTTLQPSTPPSTPRSNNVVVPMRTRSASAPTPESSDMGRDYPYPVPNPSFEPATVQTSTPSKSDNPNDLDEIPF
ncbi:MAG TPA: single-stranded DNA-binding protein [Cyanobacteria bacterium UBA11370]|nr:single-stranded DNA-binding protein [Cyanobacteria bacterium UBA11370]